MYGAAAVDDLTVLARRVEDAIANAVAITRRSALVRAASEQRRSGGFTTRCAWCGRYAVGDTFPEPADTPQFVAFTDSAHVTHGICPACVEQLQREGKSR
jgi:hypothetical protein